MIEALAYAMATLISSAIQVTLITAQMLATAVLAVVKTAKAGTENAPQAIQKPAAPVIVYRSRTKELPIREGHIKYLPQPNRAKEAQRR